jgi:hypothetical protein
MTRPFAGVSRGGIFEPRGLAPGWSAIVPQETGEVFAALGINRRIDSVRWVPTLPAWHGRIFDVFQLAVDRIICWLRPELLFWSSLDFILHPLQGVRYADTGFRLDRSGWSRQNDAR